MGVLTASGSYSTAAAGGTADDDDAAAGGAAEISGKMRSILSEISVCRRKTPNNAENADFDDDGRPADRPTDQYFKIF